MSTEMIEKVWPDWKVQEVLGKGSYGTVYRAVRSDGVLHSEAAIKVISVPLDQSEVDSVRAEFGTEEKTRTYFQGIVNNFVQEIQLMDSLKGTQNIVSIEDYKVMERPGQIGWDIIIRMELLTPFNTYIRSKAMTEAEVLKLGVDICSALELCGRKNVIHRDIKPENIFINDLGYFKLGDFGIARTLENATGGLSQKGTYNYMAPEVAASRNYDARADLYSLGIMLYRLLNHNRLPFIENEQQLLNPNARKEAVDRRLRGDYMAPPAQASAQAAAVVMQACAYSPDARFANATVMKKALEQAANGTYVIQQLDLDATVAVRHAAVNVDATIGVATGANRQSQGQMPNVQGWQAVNVAPQPVVQPVVQPVAVAPQPAYVPPQPVYVPPQPVVNPNISAGTVPPVNPNISAATVPPVNPNISAGTVPPVNPNISTGTVPPVRPAAPKSAAKGKLNLNCILALAAAIMGLFLYDSAPEACIGAGVVAIMCAISGKIAISKKNERGFGLGLAAVIVSIFDLADGFGNAMGSNELNYMTGMMETEYNVGAAAVGGVIGVVGLLIFLFLGKKKKVG